MNEEQLNRLCSGVLVWNEWRNTTNEAIDLSGAKLSNKDLRGADLCKADLHGSDFQGANLSGANLVRADLRGADLHGAVLQDADLTGADLLRANLAEANLREANLQEPYLRGANLQGATLQGCPLHDADLGGADLRRANLREASLWKADLRWADLQDAILTGTNLREADFTGANLRGVNLRDVVGISAYLRTPLQGLVFGSLWFKLVDWTDEGVFRGGIKYVEGKTYEEVADVDPGRECSAGINVAPLDWCLKEWIAGGMSRKWSIFVIDALPSDIACIPDGTDGKVRLHRCTVGRRLSWEELGFPEKEN